MEEKLGICPYCGGEIRENQWCYYCENRKWNREEKALEPGSCTFKIQKSTTMYEVGEFELHELLTNGKTSQKIVHGTRKDGSPWEARLALNPSPDGDFTTRFDFED